METTIDYCFKTMTCCPSSLNVTTTVALQADFCFPSDIIPSKRNIVRKPLLCTGIVLSDAEHIMMKPLWYPGAVQPDTSFTAVLPLQVL